MTLTKITDTNKTSQLFMTDYWHWAI